MADKRQLKKWTPTQPIKYIDKKWLDAHGIKLSQEELDELKDNEKKLGIQIDWQLVRKEYAKLKCPKSTHNPLKADMENTGYIIDMSDRSRGKTTNKLLLGLILFKLYGIVLHYVRQRKEDCALKSLRDLYKTVLEHKYIEKIFGNEYNDIEYIGKRWYLVKRGADGSVKYSCEDNCTFCVGLDESDGLKSTYNAPRGDMIFHDEFISTVYGYNDFIRFSDICKTIIRDRLSPVIFMSSNTINLNSQWFDELCIRKDVEMVEQGDSKYIISPLGTHIFFEMLNPDTSDVRENVNKRFWGFPNPRLASITGKGKWATESFQHIPLYRDSEAVQPRTLQNILFLTMAGKYVKLKLVDDAERGVCVFVTPASKVYDDSIILTADDIHSKREVFGIGKGTFIEAYWRLYDKNKFYYATNAEGALVRAYLGYYKSKYAKMKG